MRLILAGSDSLIDSIINGITLNQFSVFDILVTMLAAILSGIAIIITYRYSYQGTVYSHQFNISLLLMDLITAMIILTISSNLILSLGMVGALSIVRFRSAIKDPVDIVYIFWAISAGLAAGANQLTLLAVSTIVIAGGFFISSRITLKRNAYVIVIKIDASKESVVEEVLKNHRHKVRSKFFESDKLEMTIEVKEGEHEILGKLNAIGADYVSLLKFDA